MSSILSEYKLVVTEFVIKAWTMFVQNGNLKPVVTQVGQETSQDTVRSHSSTRYRCSFLNIQYVDENSSSNEFLKVRRKKGKCDVMQPGCDTKQRQWSKKSCVMFEMMWRKCETLWVSLLRGHMWLISHDVVFWLTQAEPEDGLSYASISFAKNSAQAQVSRLIGGDGGVTTWMRKHLKPLLKKSYILCVVML